MKLQKLTEKKEKLENPDQLRNRSSLSLSLSLNYIFLLVNGQGRLTSESF